LKSVKIAFILSFKFLQSRDSNKM